MSQSLFTLFDYQEALPPCLNYPYVRHDEPLLTALVAHCQRHLPAPDLSRQGNMMGVLAVTNRNGQLGHVMASSHKTGNALLDSMLVPPLIDYSSADYQQAITLLTQVEQQIQHYINDNDLLLLDHQLAWQQQQLDQQLAQVKQSLKQAKKGRQHHRSLIEQSNPEQSEQQLALLAQYSMAMKQVYQQCQHSHDLQYQQLQSQRDQWHQLVNVLQQQASHNVATLQQHLINTTKIRNARGELCVLSALIKEEDNTSIADQVSPALLHYAYQHQLHPIAMTEFWWGGPAQEAVRHHGYCYPSNHTVCQRLLDYMLQGVTVVNNPLVVKAEQAKAIQVLYQDDVMVVIDKPEHLLSVMGRDIKDSVQQRLQALFPHAESDMIVHRLDMETSGLMVLALTKKAHQVLQQQFINKTVRKRYIALLDGIVEQDQGKIDVPIRTDFKDRPRQRVCERYGKKAITEWQVLARQDKQTLMAFYPQTGRTHQIRLHAAHWRGLACPIVGDSLYGRPAKRLHLHAEQLMLNHPVTGKRLTFTAKKDF